MTGIKYKGIIDIKGVITPQSILIDNGSIYIFDKINIDEGRLYRIDSMGAHKQLLIEVDDGECFFGKDGFVYILSADDNSSIEVYDFNGNKVRDIELSGTAYFIDIDTDGCIQGMFLEDDDMSIRIYDKTGSFMREIHSRNMRLLTSIYSDNEYIYAAGLSESIPLRIEKINHMSYIINQYDSGFDNKKTIISKILKYEDTLIALASGPSKDSIVFINEDNGESKHIKLDEYGINTIYDIFIKDDILYLLTGDRKVVLFDMVKECTEIVDKSRPINEIKFVKRSYGYLFCLICIKNLLYDFFSLLLKAGIPGTMLIVLYLQLRYNISQDYQYIKEYTSYFIVLSSIITLFSIIVKNIIVSIKRSKRLDNLLDIYNRIDDMKSTVSKSSFLLGGILSVILFGILFNSSLKGSILFLILIVFGAGCTAVAYIVSLRYIGRFKNEIDNIVFELLSFKSEDEELLKRIAKQVKKQRTLGVERYIIKVHTKNKLAKDAVKLIKKWSNLRGKITGDAGTIKKQSEYLIFDLNLKNRDIKYSRVSVIEDFICYITNAVNISSVIIENPNEEDSKR